MTAADDDQGFGLYTGTVVHQRFSPVRHVLRYRVFSLLVDLDRVAETARRLRLFAYNGAAPLSLHDRDHGPGDGTPLVAWVRAELAAAGLAEEAEGPVRLLCYPRLWGYAFNPLSVYWCHRRDGSLAAVLHEVSNTFGQRHVYLIPVPRGAQDAAGLVRQRAAKGFHVSPFLDMDLTYRFTLRPPGERVGIVIDEHEADGMRLLHAAFTGRRRPLSDAAMARALAASPLMTAKVIAGIHWEALRLWRKGLAVRPRPPAPARLVTVVPQAENDRQEVFPAASGL